MGSTWSSEIRSLFIVIQCINMHPNQKNNLAEMTLFYLRFNMIQRFFCKTMMDAKCMFHYWEILEEGSFSFFHFWLTRKLFRTANLTLIFKLKIIMQVILYSWLHISWKSALTLLPVPRMYKQPLESSAMIKSWVISYAPSCSIEAAQASLVSGSKDWFMPLQFQINDFA